MVNANLNDHERANDANHQYTKKTRKKLGLDK